MGRLAISLIALAACGRIGYDSMAGGGVGSGAASPALNDLPANTVRDLGPYSCTDIVDQCRSIMDWGSFVYDGRRKQILIFGGGFELSRRTDVAMFKPATLSWESAYPPTPCPEMVPENLDTEHAAWR